MELFNNSDTADGYSSNRPYFHPIVINKVKERLGLTKRLKKGLDVGCGAGLSSIALLEITQNVVGFDSSAFMISSAIKSDRIIYLNYSAEDMPIDQQYDIITLSGSINWIDRNLFFARSLHVLKSQGYIVIYDNDILGEMVGEPSFTYWYHNIFLNVYPRPPRNESLLENELLNRYGFKVEYSERYTNRIRFNLECFISYLLTLSNLITAIGSGKVSSNELADWLRSELGGYFKTEEQTLMFGGYIWFVKKK